MDWFTADTHFGHKNVIVFCERPYADKLAMNEALIENWNACVNGSDRIFVLGDFSFMSRSHTKYILGRLNGHKILIAGNHDDGRSCQTWVNLGFHEAYDNYMYTPEGQKDYSFQLNHFPYSGDYTAAERFMERRPKDNGMWLLHGHVHKLWKVRNRQINCGTDVWNYHPVSIDQIQDITKGSYACC